MRIEDVNYMETQFWVQIHGLELDKLNHDNAQLIGQNIGEVVQIDQTLGLKAFGVGDRREQTTKGGVLVC